MERIYILLYAAALLTLGACQERIDIRVGNSTPGLVIYGHITTDTTAHAIRITRSADYFAETPPEGISGAAVSITASERTYTLAESATDPGLYLTEPDVYGTVGETYTLHVSVDFNASGRPEAFEATSILPPAPVVDSIGFAVFPAYDRLIQVMIWGWMPQSELINYISSHLYLNGVLYNDSLHGYRINNDQYFAASREIKGIPLFVLNQERDNEKLSPGDTVTVQLEGITAAYATFIESAQSEVSGSNPMFGGPPANVQSNIRCLTEGSPTLVLGFFGAYSKQTRSVVFRE